MRSLYPLCIILISIFAFQSNAQERGIFKPRLSDIGLEVQAYPAGLISGIRSEFALSPYDAINLRAGVNIARRQDFGVHQNEEGEGFGAGLGYRRYLRGPLHGFFLGGKADIWQLHIRWKDDLVNIGPNHGTTNITVLQPTIEGGYLFLSNNGRWSVAPNVAFGFEINAVTKGEAVGQGAILLGGLQFAHRFAGN